MKLRKIVYTWDYRMRWADIKRPFIRSIGGSPYPYGDEIFQDDYKLAIDFLAKHGFEGIIVWGFLRDSHGGISAANKLCDYALSKGIRIIAGVGVNSYGGVYWEGDNEFNLDTWLKKRPELAGLDSSEEPVIKGLENSYGEFNRRSIACPSKKENDEWNLKGVEWLVNTIENIGGIWFENSDYALCQCQDCRARGNRTQPRSPEDDKRIVPLIEKAYSINKNLWLFGDIGIGFWPSGDKHPVRRSVWDMMRKSTVLPDYALRAIRMDYNMGERKYSEESLNLMDKWNDEWGKMLKHTYGFAAYSSLNSYDEDFILIERIKRLCIAAQKMGLEGVSMYGELGNFSAKMNYMALEAFSANPDLSLEHFLKGCAKKIEFKKS